MKKLISLATFDKAMAYVDARRREETGPKVIYYVTAEGWGRSSSTWTYQFEVWIVTGAIWTP